MDVDIKKFGRIDGVGDRITGDPRSQSNRRARKASVGEFVHCLYDDASRIAFGQVMPNEKTETHRLPNGRPGLLPKPQRYRRPGVTVRNPATKPSPSARPA